MQSSINTNQDKYINVKFIDKKNNISVWLVFKNNNLEMQTLRNCVKCSPYLLDHRPKNNLQETNVNISFFKKSLVEKIAKLKTPSKINSFFASKGKLSTIGMAKSLFNLNLEFASINTIGFIG